VGGCHQGGCLCHADALVSIWASAQQWLALCNGVLETVGTVGTRCQVPRCSLAQGQPAAALCPSNQSSRQLLCCQGNLAKGDMCGSASTVGCLSLQRVHGACAVIPMQLRQHISQSLPSAQPQHACSSSKPLTPATDCIGNVTEINNARACF
jgi:hypothetical protein